MATSARDDARLGHLFLRDGRWSGRQLISEEWVRLSTTVQASTGDDYHFDYGFLWWVDSTHGAFYAWGNSGQFIGVFPQLDMVIVFRADPGGIIRKWLGRRVDPRESFRLVPMILAARKESDG